MLDSEPPDSKLTRLYGFNSLMLNAKFLLFCNWQNYKIQYTKNVLATTYCTIDTQTNSYSYQSTNPELGHEECVIVDRNRAASYTSIACSAHISAAVIAIHLSMISY